MPEKALPRVTKLNAKCFLFLHNKKSDSAHDDF